MLLLCLKGRIKVLWEHKSLSAQIHSTGSAWETVLNFVGRVFWTGPVDKHSQINISVIPLYKYNTDSGSATRGLKQVDVTGS